MLPIAMLFILENGGSGWVTLGTKFKKSILLYAKKGFFSC